MRRPYIPLGVISVEEDPIYERPDILTRQEQAHDRLADGWIEQHGGPTPDEAAVVFTYDHSANQLEEDGLKEVASFTRICQHYIWLAARRFNPQPRLNRCKRQPLTGV